MTDLNSIRAEIAVADTDALALITAMINRRHAAIANSAPKGEWITGSRELLAIGKLIKFTTPQRGTFSGKVTKINGKTFKVLVVNDKGSMTWSVSHNVAYKIAS
jgi:hypothetical protein